MELSERSDHELRWSDSEKKTARRAFDKAFERQCAAIAAEVRRMLDNAHAPSDLWRIQEYLTENRKSVDQIYDYRYSRLSLVFSILIRDGWLKKADLAGLGQEKINRITLGAKL
jgi:hypothetical protein